MQFLISFLEGMITFISPCLLPMLPMYVSFFVGEQGTKHQHRTFFNALSFVFGFTIVFVLLGVFAGSLGQLLWQYQTMIHIVTGIIVIVFGLNFMGVFRIPLLNMTYKITFQMKNSDLISCFVFGMIFSIGWTPCVGTFLGAALMMVVQEGTMINGIFSLLAYSLGLGIPFLLSALFIEKLSSTMTWIKKHYQKISFCSGLFLVFVGVMMMFGLLNQLLLWLSIV